MLCKVVEKRMEKCAEYWNNKKYKMKNFEINIEDESYLDTKNKDVIIRNFKLINLKRKTSQNVTQIHLTSWEDHTSLSSDYNDKIIRLIKMLKNNKNKSPIVVHCSAGVGRTGTFISLYNLHDEITQQLLMNENNVIKFSIFNLVRKIKELRRYMVENEDQYIFLYNFVNYLLYCFN